MNKSFDQWWLNNAQAELRESCAKGWALKIWEAATNEPDPETVAKHFGYEVTKIRDTVFIAKNNASFTVWVPFNRGSHPGLFQEYDKCL